MTLDPMSCGKELNEVINKFKLVPITPSLESEMFKAVTALLKRHDLEDVKFTIGIEEKTGIVKITPLRKIDGYVFFALAVCGEIELSDNIKL